MLNKNKRNTLTKKHGAERCKRKPGKSRGQVLFNVYCKCRQIENGEMIQSNNCGEWYHESCVDVSSDQKVETIWMCTISLYNAIKIIIINNLNL